jgi:hypothetical protein
MHQTYHSHIKSFWTHPMELLGDMVMKNLLSVLLEIVLVSVHDGCMVCALRTIGSKFVSDTLVGPPGWRGSNESSFWSVWRQC